MDFEAGFIGLGGHRRRVLAVDKAQHAGTQVGQKVLDRSASALSFEQDGIVGVVADPAGDLMLLSDAASGGPESDALDAADEDDAESVHGFGSDVGHIRSIGRVLGECWDEGPCGLGGLGRPKTPGERPTLARLGHFV